MVDFHSHFLPAMDDGSKDPEMSIAMLQESFRQGVDVIFATPHFYADENDPAAFIRRRNASCRALREYYRTLPKGSVQIPRMYLGAEVYYFPGISECEEIVPLAMGNTKMLLVEPPVAPFSESMLNEIEHIYTNLGLIPLMAHLDRYETLLRDYTLFERVAAHRIDIQVNATFFLRDDTADRAISLLRQEKFALMGSDCHNMTGRAPNLGPAKDKILSAGAEKSLAKIDSLAYNVINFDG